MMVSTRAILHMLQRALSFSRRISDLPEPCGYIEHCVREVRNQGTIT